MINVDLIERTLDHVKEHPEEHNQGIWATRSDDELPDGNTCGTAYCFAGHAVLLSGHKITFDKDSAYLLDGNPFLTIEQVAREELGLDSIEAGVLFRSSPDIATLESNVRSIIRFEAQLASAPTS